MFVGAGILDGPKQELSEVGIVIQKYIEAMDGFYEDISVDKYVVMPNHIHMIIEICGGGTSGMPSPTNNRLSFFVATLKRHINREVGANIFQRSFNDHIIRGEKDYRKIWEYIDTNPARWQEGCFYTNDSE